MRTMAVALVAVVGMAFSAGAGEWRFSNGGEFPGASGMLEADGEGVLHLRYDFIGGGAYVGAYQDLDPPLTLRSVSFRVKKPAEAQLTLRVIDSTDQGLQEPVSFDHGEWQRVEVDMMNFDAHWGGANDGVVHFPVKSVGILVEKAGLESPAGEVLLEDIAFNGGDKGPDDPYEFRGGYLVTDFGRDAGFGVSGGTLEGNAWNIDFAKTESASLHHSLSLFGSPHRITLNLRGGLPGNVVSIGLGSHFQGFHRTLGTIQGPETSLTVDLPPAEGWEHGGGENDGVVRLPLRLTTLSIARGAATAQPTKVELVGLTCETVLPRDEARLGFARLQEHPGGQLEAACTAYNLFDGPVLGAMTVVLRDWERNELASTSFTQELPANGRPVQIARTFEVPADRQFAEAEFIFKAEKGGFTAQAAWARPMTDPGEAALRPESPWGMGVYLYRYPDPAGGSDEMERAAALAQAAGVKWSREEFSWARTEPQQGQYDFAFYDAVVDTARRHGISVYGLLSYWSNWTDPYTEKGIDDFCVWAKAVVGHFKDRVKHWEIYNEPNIFFWSGPKELYPVLMKKCYAAIKEADPEAQVLAISTAGIDLEFIDLCLQAGAPFDILTIHPYRGYLSERGFANELRRVAERVNNRPVWITEMGWSTHIGGRDERSQACLLARTYLTAIASGACQNVSWYDFRNDGTDRFYNEANFGVLRNDLTPKPAYRALATVCRTLAAGAPRLLAEGPGVWAAEVGNARVVWAPLKGYRQRCRVEGEPQFLNLMGEPVTPAVEGTDTILALHPGQPVFVVGATSFALVGEPEESGEKASQNGLLTF